MHVQGTTEAAIASAANKVGAFGGTTAVVGWMNASNIFAAIGAIAAVGGFLVGWYYRRKSDKREAAYKAIEDQREAELHAARLQQIREGRE